MGRAVWPSLWPVLVLALALAVLWWTWPRQPVPMVTIDWQGKVQRGDQAASDVLLREYDAEGKLVLLARAATAYHLPQGSQTFLDDLQVTRYRSQGNLHLTAQHGLLRNGDQELEVWDQVHALLEPNTTLSTARLRYDPHTEIIATQSPVRLTHGRNTLDGIGLWASVKTEEIKILEQVRGNYVP